MFVKFEENWMYYSTSDFLFLEEKRLNADDWLKKADSETDLRTI